MAVLEIDSEQLSEEQFKAIHDLYNSYIKENSSAISIASAKYAKQLLAENIKDPEQGFQRAFIAGSDWQYNLLTQEEYQRILYILAAAFSTSEYDDETKRGAMLFLNKLSRIFKVDIQSLL